MAPLPRPAPALVIAVIGAAGTGKSTLAAALADWLADATGLRCTWVPALPHDDSEGGAPHGDGLPSLLRAQHARIAVAARTHDLVVCDTTALDTAVHQRLRYADRSLEAPALALHREQVALTLLTALDLPCAADDPALREPVDDALRALLRAAGLPWALVGGQGPDRVESALDAIAPLLRRRATPRQGLLTRLAQRNASAPRWDWVCEKCDVPECEHVRPRR